MSANEDLDVVNVAEMFCERVGMVETLEAFEFRTDIVDGVGDFLERDTAFVIADDHVFLVAHLRWEISRLIEKFIVIPSRFSVRGISDWITVVGVLS